MLYYTITAFLSTKQYKPINIQYTFYILTYTYIHMYMYVTYVNLCDDAVWHLKKRNNSTPLHCFKYFSKCQKIYTQQQKQKKQATKKI